MGHKHRFSRLVLLFRRGNRKRVHVHEDEDIIEPNLVDTCPVPGTDVHGVPPSANRAPVRVPTVDTSSKVVSEPLYYNRVRPDIGSSDSGYDPDNPQYL